MASQIGVTLKKIKGALLRLGLFDSVSLVEPKSPPGPGLTAAIFFTSAGPAANASGLDRASSLYVFTVRIYYNFLVEPVEEIDSVLVKALDAVLDALAGDIDLGATVRNVDFFGSAGTPLSAKAGYADCSGVIFRCVDILLPLMVNDSMAAFG
jgi:hypothetical protein